MPVLVACLRAKGMMRCPRATSSSPTLHPGQTQRQPFSRPAPNDRLFAFARMTIALPNPNCHVSLRHFQTEGGGPRSPRSREGLSTKSLAFALRRGRQSKGAWAVRFSF